MIKLTVGDFLLFPQQDRLIFPIGRFEEFLEYLTRSQKESILRTLIQERNYRD